MHAKEIRWKQRFENFEKAYKLLEKYSSQPIETELERAGIIQFFEMTVELAWKVWKDYLEAQGFLVKSPRETIKQAFQSGYIADGHTWLEALLSRNQPSQMYDEEKAKEMIDTIKLKFLPLFADMYHTLAKEC
ncbi:nucleotidyltransferase substrate binding protein [Litoribacterium kuwaitense]|uniref:nucleotidyltransferase substrate binding protein n=1 Tax=Litoribacterium kuwaitense TaxID=1398745 RepID=UPI001BA994EE|nr:nucleotidyltransferase substrate binding protein [Litoribacterium kuwaitense]